MIGSSVGKYPGTDVRQYTLSQNLYSSISKPFGRVCWAVKYINFFSSPHPPRLTLWPTHLRVRRVPELLPGDKAVGAWRWRSTPSSAEVKECIQLCLHGTLRETFTFAVRIKWSILRSPDYCGIRAASYYNVGLLYVVLGLSICKNRDRSLPPLQSI
jgi:hypothetical protein